MVNKNFEPKFLIITLCGVGLVSPPSLQTEPLPTSHPLSQRQYLGAWGLVSARDSSRALCRASSSLCKREKEDRLPQTLFSVGGCFCLLKLRPTHQAILQGNHWRGGLGWRLGCPSKEDIQEAEVRDAKGKNGEKNQAGLPTCWER